MTSNFYYHRFLLLATLVLVFQSGSVLAQDSLSKRSVRYLEAAATTNSNSSSVRFLYANAWLRQAKKEGNLTEVSLAYKALLYAAPCEQQEVYLDSLVTVSLQSKDHLLIGSAYITKATLYYGRKQHRKALDNFLLADRYIILTEDQYSKYKIKFGIAQTKYSLGFYQESISLIRECIDYFKEDNDRAYLNSLHALSLNYNKTGNYAWCTITNQLGIDEGRRLENLAMEPYFLLSEAVNYCSQGKYEKTIHQLLIVLPKLDQIDDHANKTVAYFYLGKSLWELNKHDEAIDYFSKVDSVFTKEHYIRTDFREGYEHLISYYKAKDDTKHQLLYINKLLKVDQFLAKDYAYLVNKIVKEYDSRQLQLSKERLEQELRYKSWSASALFIVMFGLLLYLFLRHRKQTRRYHQLFAKQSALKNLPPKIVKDVIFDLSPELEAALLKNLENFESKKKYIEKDMTLNTMAQLLHTNTKYVTKIIAKYRCKGSIEYITDLKIDYIIELLKNEKRCRNYTNQALAQEAGFGSTQNFTRAFKARTGISPTFFIYKLRKEED